MARDRKQCLISSCSCQIFTIAEYSDISTYTDINANITVFTNSQIILSWKFAKRTVCTTFSQNNIESNVTAATTVYLVTETISDETLKLFQKLENIKYPDSKEDIDAAFEKYNMFTAAQKKFLKEVIHQITKSQYSKIDFCIFLHFSIINLHLPSSELLYIMVKKLNMKYQYKQLHLLNS